MPSTVLEKDVLVLGSVKPEVDKAVVLKSLAETDSFDVDVAVGIVDNMSEDTVDNSIEVAVVDSLVVLSILLPIVLNVLSLVLVDKAGRHWETKIAASASPVEG